MSANRITNNALSDDPTMARDLLDSPEFATVMARLMETYPEVTAPDGTARQALWDCEDGWVVGYTTERINGGRMPGKYAAMAYRPTGKGSRSGRANHWKRVYFRGFSTRRAAKSRATALYWRHCPKRAGRSGVAV